MSESVSSSFWSHPPWFRSVHASHVIMTTATVVGTVTSVVLLLRHMGLLKTRNAENTQKENVKSRMSWLAKSASTDSNSELNIDDVLVDNDPASTETIATVSTRLGGCSRTVRFLLMHDWTLHVQYEDSVDIDETGQEVCPTQTVVTLNSRRNDGRRRNEMMFRICSGLRTLSSVTGLEELQPCTMLGTNRFKRSFLVALSLANGNCNILLISERAVSSKRQVGHLTVASCKYDGARLKDRSKEKQQSWTCLALGGNTPTVYRNSFAVCVLQKSRNEIENKQVLVAYGKSDGNSSLTSSSGNRSIALKLLCTKGMQWQNVSILAVDRPHFIESQSRTDVIESSNVSGGELQSDNVGRCIELCSSTGGRIILATMTSDPDSLAVWVLDTCTSYTNSISSLKSAAHLGKNIFSASRVILNALGGDNSSISSRALVVSGPSGVGKGSLLNMLMQDYSQQVGFSVSHTSRKARPGEKDGVHYHFRTKDEILEGVKSDVFIEYAHVHNNVYGTSKQAIMDVVDDGRVCLLDIDTQGAQSVKASGIPCTMIFVMPPSVDELEKRLRGRGTETEDVVLSRMRNATYEMNAALGKNSPFDIILVNDDLKSSYQLLQKVIPQCVMELQSKKSVVSETVLPEEFKKGMSSQLYTLQIDKGSILLSHCLTKQSYHLCLSECDGGPGYSIGCNWKKELVYEVMTREI